LRSIRGYHRPQTLDEAIGLLARSGVTTRLLGGGTSLNADPGVDPFEVVDLQALGLDGITTVGASVAIAAMTRLQDVGDNEVVPPLLRNLAHREGPNTLRNAATIGGVVASADPESELLAGLLVHEAAVVVTTQEGSTELSLGDLLHDRRALRGGVITSVKAAKGGVSAADRTGRTPADRPIVAVIGRRTEDGRTLVAVTGVASTPVLVELDQVDALQPAGDFRGSSEYRRALARVLVDRVVSRLGEQS